eukprot:COSAG06_NODE_1365_length_9687_cov_14.601064_5_plen_138_part_00
MYPQGFLTRQGAVVPSALEMLMAELSLSEEDTMARRKKKDAARTRNKLDQHSTQRPPSSPNKLVFLQNFIPQDSFLEGMRSRRNATIAATAGRSFEERRNERRKFGLGQVDLYGDDGVQSDGSGEEEGYAPATDRGR